LFNYANRVSKNRIAYLRLRHHRSLYP
jgi:hypothetical protein